MYIRLFVHFLRLFVIVLLNLNHFSTEVKIVISICCVCIITVPVKRLISIISRSLPQILTLVISISYKYCGVKRIINFQHKPRIAF